MSSAENKITCSIKHGVPTPIVGAFVYRPTTEEAHEKENLKSSRSLIPESGIPQEEKGSSLWKSYGGMIMAFSASVCFSTVFLIVKTLANSGLGSFGAALLLNIGILVPCILCIVYNEFGPGWQRRDRVLQDLWPFDTPDKKKSIGMLAIQGTVQGMGVIFRTYSLRYLTLADTTVIVFSSPVVTTVFAHFILGEACGVVFIAIALFTFVGVILITKPPVLTGEKEFDRNTMIGSGLAVGALLSLSMKFVITRKIKKVHFLAMTFALGFSGVMITLPLFLMFEEIHSLGSTTVDGILLRLGMCILSFNGVLSINLALKKEDAGLVSLIRSCDVIFAFVFQFIFLGVTPDMWSFIGAAIVWSGVLIAGGRKMWMQKRANRKRRGDLLRS